MTAAARTEPLLPLAFLIDWPALDRAAGLIMARTAELDGDHYWLLTPAADAFEQRHPLAATLVLRAIIDLSLDAAKYKRYGHAARHLKTCEHLALSPGGSTGSPGIPTTPGMWRISDGVTHVRAASGMPERTERRRM